MILYLNMIFFMWIESRNEADSNDDNMDGLQTDEDNEDESLVDGTEDGGEENDVKPQKVATQVRNKLQALGFCLFDKKILCWLCL